MGTGHHIPITSPKSLATSTPLKRTSLWWLASKSPYLNGPPPAPSARAQCMVIGSPLRVVLAGISLARSVENASTPESSTTEISVKVLVIMRRWHRHRDGGSATRSRCRVTARPGPWADGRGWLGRVATEATGLLWMHLSANRPTRVVKPPRDAVTTAQGKPVSIRRFLDGSASASRTSCGRPTSCGTSNGKLRDPWRSFTTQPLRRRSSLDPSLRVARCGPRTAGPSTGAAARHS